MKLTKREQTALIGLIYGVHGPEVKEHIHPEKVKKFSPAFVEIEDNTTPKQKRQDIISALDKIIDNFIKNINVVDTSK
ncbi:hypothetical protein COE56_30520 [Bacillus anthracis]|nr:hypothetical protein COE56_30520 [Bacillus anthracis]